MHSRYVCVFVDMDSVEVYSHVEYYNIFTHLYSGHVFAHFLVSTDCYYFNAHSIDLLAYLFVSKPLSLSHSLVSPLIIRSDFLSSAMFDAPTRNIATRSSSLNLLILLITA